MYLSHIEIFGFKSFGHRVKVDFKNGVSSIVGPNGTGKTNIIDAVRWVIGERRIKLLRGGSLDDVIFNGTSSKKPLNMAEVTITFNDCRGLLQFDPDASQLVITRRAFRDGNSEFIINSRAVRMKDVRQTLLSLGISSGVYSIIEQYMMKQIIDEDPESRRMLFEEAADILKFKNDRKSTESKLDTTIQDLERIEDIRDEIKKNVDRLRKQASRAKRYSRMKNELSALKNSIALTQYREWDTKLTKANTGLKELSDKLLILRAEKARFAEAHTNHRELETKTQNSRKDISTELNTTILEIGRIEKEIAVLQEKNKQATLDSERSLREKQIAKEKIGELSVNENDLEEDKERIEKRIPNIKSSESDLQIEIDELNLGIMDKTKKRNELFEQKRTKERLEWEQTQKRKQLSEKQDTLKEDFYHILSRISELEENLEKSESKLESLDISNAESNLEDIQKELQNISTNRRETEKVISKTRNDIITKQGEQSRLGGELEGLSVITNDARNAILKRKKEFNILGVLADFLIPDNEETAKMLQVVLGEKAEFFVVEKAEDAEYGIKLLNEKRLGVQGFVVLSELTESKKGSLAQKIKTEYPQLLSFVSGVDIEMEKSKENDLPYMPVELPDNSAVNISMFWKKGLRYGGYSEKGIINVKVRERKLKRLLDENKVSIENLNKETQDLQKKLQQIRKNEENTGIQFKIYEKKLYNDRLLKRQVEIDISNIERELSQKRTDSMSIDSQLKGIEKELAVKPIQDEKHSGIDSLIGSLSSEIEGLKNQGRLKEDKQKELQFELVQYKGEVKRIEDNLARIGMSISEMRRTLDRARQTEIKAASQKSEGNVLINELSDELQQGFRTRDRQQTVLSEISNNENEIRKKLSTITHNTKEIEKRIELTEQEHHQLDNDKIRLSSKLETLIADFSGIENLAGDTLSSNELSKTELEVVLLSEKITSFGPVNFEAESEYELENSRFEHYQTQLRDINQSVKTLRQSIAKLNGEAEKLFVETFEQARANFKMLFRELFNGGDADIELVNKDGSTENVNVLEAEINVITQPPGKKRLNITQLSQGESSLVAISLLFGLYLVRPSPFCFLDEVDAPLDEVNVGRFIKIVRRFQDNTQFILITHNRKTMQAMDYIYGMTMEEGVSQVVSMAIGELNKDYLDEIGAK